MSLKYWGANPFSALYIIWATTVDLIDVRVAPLSGPLYMVEGCDRWAVQSRIPSHSLVLPTS